MKQKRFDEAQIIGILKQRESGITVAPICGAPAQRAPAQRAPAQRAPAQRAPAQRAPARWKSKYGGMEVHEATRLRQLEQENARLKKLLAESLAESLADVAGRRSCFEGCASKKMVKPAARKEGAGYVQEEHQLSKRRAQTSGLFSGGHPDGHGATGTARYQSRKTDEAPVRARLKELAQERPGFGYRVSATGAWTCCCVAKDTQSTCNQPAINLQRVLRLYREENLKLRARKRRRVTSTLRVKPQQPTRLNRQRRLETCGKPEVIQVDNGSEFTGRALDEWAHRNQVKLHFILHFILPGKPTQNGVIESFNGKMRDQCLSLNLEWFLDLHHARDIIENWRHDYNTFRPHSRLNNLPPTTWAQNQTEILLLQVG